jgi:hypothetical protein
MMDDDFLTGIYIAIFAISFLHGEVNVKIKWDDKPVNLPTHPMGLSECLARYGHSVPDGDLKMVEKSMWGEQFEADEQDMEE